MERKTVKVRRSKRREERDRRRGKQKGKKWTAGEKERKGDEISRRGKVSTVETKM